MNRILGLLATLLLLSSVAAAGPTYEHGYEDHTPLNAPPGQSDRAGNCIQCEREMEELTEWTMGGLNNFEVFVVVTAGTGTPGTNGSPPQVPLVVEKILTNSKPVEDPQDQSDFYANQDYTPGFGIGQSLSSKWWPTPGWKANKAKLWKDLESGPDWASWPKDGVCPTCEARRGGQFCPKCGTAVPHAGGAPVIKGRIAPETASQEAWAKLPLAAPPSGSKWIIGMDEDGGTGYSSFRYPYSKEVEEWIEARADYHWDGVPEDWDFYNDRRD